MQHYEPRLYVTDTHSLIWYLLDSPKLSSNANQAFLQIDSGEAKLIIPAIVIAEIIFLVQKERIKAELDDLFAKIQSSENFQVSTLGLNELFF